VIEGGKQVSQVHIKRIHKNGLFDNAANCLRTNDHILSVNNVSTRGMRASQVAKLIQSAASAVALTCRNPTVDPSMMASTVQKATPAERVGISMRNSNIRSGGVLLVSRVEVDGLFADSLLAPGHQIVYLNGRSCSNVRTPEAVHWVHHQPPAATPLECSSEGEGATSTVTIISRPHVGKTLYGLVLSCERPRRPVLRALAVGLGLTSLGTVGIARSVN
jgi:C-terminal processing protease CtpA/Prc